MTPDTPVLDTPETMQGEGTGRLGPRGGLGSGGRVGVADGRHDRAGDNEGGRGAVGAGQRDTDRSGHCQRPWRHVVDRPSVAVPSLLCHADAGESDPSPSDIRSLTSFLTVPYGDEGPCLAIDQEPFHGEGLEGYTDHPTLTVRRYPT